MKSRVDDVFKSLRRAKRCGLIAYVTCGDPDLDTTVGVIEELERAGADAIELGVPFSDPIADGPVIQAAAQRALQKGTTLADVIEVARRVRSRSEIPLIAFSYLNPILRYGIDRFAEDASAAGFDAVLITDLPPEDADLIRASLHFRGLGLIFLLAPTSSDTRIKAIDRATDSFVYYVSTTGVTGARRELDTALLPRLDEIRGKLKHPIAVGFGISRAEHYQMLRDRCDAVVVGSAIVRAVGEGEPSGAAQRAGNIVRSILGAVAMLAMMFCASPPPAPAPQPLPTPAAPTEEHVIGTARVSASTLNVRASADTNAAVVTHVRKGTKLDVLSDNGSWLKVRLASGEVGWVSAQHVTRGDQPATARRRGGCPADSDYSFTKTPVPAFSDRSAHGLVVVEATVNTAGEVTSTKVITNNTGDETLGALAEREIRSARFQAPIRNCVPRTFIFTYKRSF